MNTNSESVFFVDKFARKSRPVVEEVQKLCTVGKSSVDFIFSKTYKNYRQLSLPNINSGFTKNV